ncbi:MAG: UxaA family hydrolase, partial [Clostridia bacterium]|nr:UxaA family hydrolase [Clostridia bacterium]
MNVKIAQKDNVFVDSDTGHKYALCDIHKGEHVVKYGYPIGTATRDIKKGDHVHTHNLKSYISENEDYTYAREADRLVYATDERTFPAYVRKNGDIGIRNDIWIVPTVG